MRIYNDYMILGKARFYELFPLEQPETLTSYKAIKNVWELFLGPNVDRKLLTTRNQSIVNIKKVFTFWLTCKFPDLKQHEVAEIIGAPRSRVPFYLKTVYNDLTVIHYAPRVIDQLQTLNYYLSLQQDREVLSSLWVKPLNSL